MTAILKKTLPMAACAAALLAGSAVSAATIDFTGANLSDRPEATFGTGDLNVTVRAGTFGDNGINFATRQVDIDPDGLGSDGFLDRDSIDGSFGNDVLTFSFDRLVRIDAIAFVEVDNNDDFAFGSVAGTSFERAFDFAQVFDQTDLSELLSANARTGLTFGIGAIGSNDNFRVAGLNVSTVPLPASGMMLLGALGAGVVLSRRRKAAKA